MDRKQRFQQDLREAMRAQDQPRVNVLRMLLAALERAQEKMGKEAFDEEAESIQPDRAQPLSEQTIEEILRDELQRRREAVDLMRTGGQEERIEMEEAEITILEEYLANL